MRAAEAKRFSEAQEAQEKRIAEAERLAEERRDLQHRDWCMQRAFAYRETIHRMTNTPWPAKTDPVFAAATEQYKSDIDELMSKIPHEIRALMPAEWI